MTQPGRRVTGLVTSSALGRGSAAARLRRAGVSRRVVHASLIGHTWRMSAYSVLFSRLYDVTLARAERAGMRELRRDVLESARGDVLEIGAGTGLNLPLYPDTITSLTLAEPEPSMVERLRARAATGRTSPTVITAPAEELPFPDDTFDTVVSTLVLCTVRDQAAALGEVLRVMRPGAALLVLEHVRGEGRVATWQDRLHGPWRLVGCGCHCNRDTATALADAGFDTAALRSARWQGVPAIVGPLITGRLHI